MTLTQTFMNAAQQIAPSVMLAVSGDESHGAAHAGGHAGSGLQAATNLDAPWVLIAVALPAIAFVLCALAAAFRVKSKLPAFLTVVCLGGSFAVIAAAYSKFFGGGHSTTGVIHAFEWMNLRWGGTEAAPKTFVANFSFYLDSLSCLWMLFVTGLATLIALYASEYMSHDIGQGYNRFYAAFSLFVLSMMCLVFGDNLVLLYLGWEGVGLCSYLLIGYFYKKPSAVAAAKKAFIVNRIGDLFLALGIFLTYVHFGSVEYRVIFEKAAPYLASMAAGKFDEIPAVVQLIPLLLMLGAFGKSAQLPLYVWLPDAMEGPTPVSALIHAATMVTAGVYLIARMYPLFLLSETALPIVGWVGALTALFAATIGMAQFDIKRIMAYSTVSQLGYMFAGLAVLNSAGAAAHVFTHAFFKAMLFLSCGAVMHGFGGQLDLRKLSGVAKMKGWTVVGVAMFVGCLNLAGFPLITAGFWSKDAILGEAFANSHTIAIGWILLLTAGLTAYYTFRVFFRVFVGPKYFEPGEDAHASHDDHGHGDAHGHGKAHDDADHGHGHGHGHGGEFHPHAPGWAINTVLIILAIASFVAVLLVKPDSAHNSWVGGMVGNSSAAYGGHATYLGSGHEHATFFGFDAHKAMLVVSSVVGLVGIAIAFVLHLQGRTTAATSRADKLLPALGPIPGWAQGKWFVDEFYDLIIRKPLIVISHLFQIIDQFLIDGIVNLFGALPSWFGRALRPAQSGELHGYAIGMAGGVAVLLIVVMLLVL
jgi:NADH-quinone oxidoreductase subunit L